VSKERAGLSKKRTGLKIIGPVKGLFGGGVSIIGATPTPIKSALKATDLRRQHRHDGCGRLREWAEAHCPLDRHGQISLGAHLALRSPAFTISDVWCRHRR